MVGIETLKLGTENSKGNEYDAVFFKANDTNEMIVLFHGWTSAPHTVTRLASKLKAEGKNVLCPILPGHMQASADVFSNTKYQAWIRFAEGYITKLVNNGYVVTAVGGLSMGAMIAADVAVKFEIKDIMMISPAFKAKDPLIYLTPIVQLFKDREPITPSIKPDNKYDSETCQFKSDEYFKLSMSIYRANTWYRSANELRKIQDYYTFLVSPYIYNKNILVIYSREDEAIDICRVSNEIGLLNILKNNSVTEIVLPKGNHEIFNDTRPETAETVIDNCIAFLK